MKKRLLALLIALAAFSQGHASEYDLFVGGEAGLSWADFSGPGGTYQNREISTYGVKAGVVDDETRMYVAYNYLDAYEDSPTRTGEYQTLTLNTEAFTKPEDIFGLFDIVFFAGAHLGAININVEANFGESEKTALLYGIQAGILLEFGLPVNLEAGYRYSLSTFSDVNTDLDSLQVAYGGINIKF